MELRCPISFLLGNCRKEKTVRHWATFTCKKRNEGERQGQKFVKGEREEGESCYQDKTTEGRKEKRDKRNRGNKDTMGGEATAQWKNRHRARRTEARARKRERAEGGERRGVKRQKLEALGKGENFLYSPSPAQGVSEKPICTRWRGARAAGPRAPGASDLRLLQPAAGCETRTGNRGGDSVSKGAVPTRFAFSSPLLPEAGTRGI